MKIIIVGAGKVGSTIAKQLIRENHNIVMIDNSSSVVEKLLTDVDLMTVVGNGASYEVQKEAGVSDADLLIAVTESDEINLLSCMLARKLGCKETAARVRNPEYNSQLRLLSEEYGLSLAVNPESYAAHAIFSFLQFPSFVKIESFTKSRTNIAEIKVDSTFPLLGVSLGEMKKRVSLNMLICAVKREESIIIPKGSYRFEEGDTLYVTAPRSELAKIVKAFALPGGKIRSVIIIGGGKIARYLTEELLSAGANVKIIEKDYKKCLELADQFPKAVIINEDGTNPQVLMEEGISDADAIVPLTGIDEQNLVISMFATHAGIRKAITKINRKEYSPLFEENEIDSIINPSELISNEIIRFVRAVESATEDAVRSLYKIVDGEVEALEFTASSQTKNLGVPLASIKIKENILVACINHRGNVKIAGGLDSFSEGDSVVVIARAEYPIRTLNDIFAEES